MGTNLAINDKLITSTGSHETRNKPKRSRKEVKPDNKVKKDLGGLSVGDILTKHQHV